MTTIDPDEQDPMDAYGNATPQPGDSGSTDTGGYGTSTPEDCNKKCGIISLLKIQGGSAKIGDEIRNRVRNIAIAYDILRRVNDGITTPALKIPPPTFPTAAPTLGDGFLDALATHVESEVIAAGMDSIILTKLVSNADNELIDKAILDQMKASLNENDLKRVVVAITITLNGAVPAAPPPTPPTLEDKAEEIRLAVDQVELKRLLTVPTDDDFVNVVAGVQKGQSPFKGLGAVMRSKLAR
jgi:hypothetical protein